MHPGQIRKDSPLLQKTITLGVDAPGINQAGVVMDSFKPGYPFIVESVQAIAQGSTASADADVQIGGTSVLDSVVSDPADDGFLEPTLAAESDRVGADDDTVDLVITTDGSGEFDDLRVHVVIRPHPAGGEPGGWKAPPGQG